MMDKVRFLLIRTIILVILVSLNLLLFSTSWAKDLPATQGELAVALTSELFAVVQPSPQDSARLLTQMGLSPEGGWDLNAPVTPELLAKIYRLLARIFSDGTSPVTKTFLVAALRAGISFPDITTTIITSGIRWTANEIATMRAAARADTNHYSALETELNKARKAIENSGISAQQRRFPFTLADFRNELLQSEKIKEVIGEEVIREVGDQFVAQILGDIISEGVRVNQPPPEQRPPQPPPTEIASPSVP